LAALAAVLALAATSAEGSRDVAVAAGVWHGSAEGILVKDREVDSGDVKWSNVSNYQVELSVSFSVNTDGRIAGTGNGTYTDAHWHLSGVNGDKGSFDCQPPVSAKPFKVDVGGRVSGSSGILTLSISDATETNDDYDCGADFKGFATTSHYMADSLSLVGGNTLAVSSTHPTARTLTKTVASGGSSSSQHDVHIWTFSITPPGGGGSGGGSGPSGSGGAGGSGSGSTTCSLSLTKVAAKPSPAHAGRPVLVSFTVSVAARATLSVAKPRGASHVVASAGVGAGANALVWGGWLGRLPAPAGRYVLTVGAKACGTTRSQHVALTTK